MSSANEMLEFDGALREARGWIEKAYDILSAMLPDDMEMDEVRQKFPREARTFEDLGQIIKRIADVGLRYETDVQAASDEYNHYADMADAASY